MTTSTQRPSLFCLILLASWLPAQESANETPAAKNRAQPQPVTVTISFRGGTMADFVTQVRNSEPRANIVVATHAADATLPAMELRGAGLDQAVASACSVATSEYLIRVHEYRGPGEPVFSVVAQPQPGNVGRMQVDPGALSTLVVSISNLTADSDRSIGLTAATILSALEAAAGASGAVPSLRYHKESGLLIARGKDDQVNVMQQALNMLERDVERRRQVVAVKEAAAAAEAARTPVKTENSR